jgi:predicted transcriptional regulator
MHKAKKLRTPDKI